MTTIARGLGAALLAGAAFVAAPVLAAPAAKTAPVAKAAPAAAAAPAATPAPAKPARAVTVTVLTPGEGAKPAADDYVLVNYKGMLPDGTVFDQNENAVMPLAEVVPGFAQGLVQMQRGGTYRMVIPSELAYGAEGGGPIPPNTDLTFEVTLLDFKTQAELQAMMSQMQAAEADREKEAGQDATPSGTPSDTATPDATGTQAQPQQH